MLLLNIFDSILSELKSLVEIPKDLQLLSFLIELLTFHKYSGKILNENLNSIVPFKEKQNFISYDNQKMRI